MSLIPHEVLAKSQPMSVDNAELPGRRLIKNEEILTLRYTKPLVSDSAERHL
jgi:hypothetical protein